MRPKLHAISLKLVADSGVAAAIVACCVVLSKVDTDRASVPAVGHVDRESEALVAHRLTYGGNTGSRQEGEDKAERDDKDLPAGCGCAHPHRMLD